MMATERWFTLVEFTFDVDTEPSKQRHEGDAQGDFASRAFWEGLKPRLDKAFPGDDGINWTVIAQEVVNEKHIAKRES
ncbi:MAG: hypothetical protein E3J26_03500 [Candidatus Zixiibacteriota bacterium]|nr:MAG: hypothetical protein E3J26_03500 [candidate division Zixibacteria bacterium]